jgi:hypothetical protein
MGDSRSDLDVGDPRELLLATLDGVEREFGADASHAVALWAANAVEQLGAEGIQRLALQQLARLEGGR